jgi:DNA-binding CsgD family transcriptional regulator
VEEMGDPLCTRKDVVALVCLEYTNSQIASRLNISPDTVKARLANAFRKFDVHKRSDLRLLMAHWDFSAWE